MANGGRDSSVLNLIIEQIDKSNNAAKSDQGKLYVLPFNPWNFSDQNQLVLQFLKQFRGQLLKFRGNAKNVERIVDALDDYAEALAPPLELVPYGGKILSHVMKFAFRGARKVLASGKKIEDIFSQLASQSAALKRRTIVLIDDIDRLNATETRQIFQLVKLTARFPYVTYVLAFDRTAVAATLQTIGVDSARSIWRRLFKFHSICLRSRIRRSVLSSHRESTLFWRNKTRHRSMCADSVTCSIEDFEPVLLPFVT